MVKGSNLFICCISLLLLVTGCRKGEQASQVSFDYIVDLYNYFGNSQNYSFPNRITFDSGVDCFSLEIDSSGDIVCPDLDGKIVMYYPSYGLICMLCDTLKDNEQLYVYINGSRYHTNCQNACAVYPIDEFFHSFIYLNLCPGDSLYSDSLLVIVQQKELYEVLDVDGDFLRVRAVKYDEDNVPRVISQPSACILRYRWRYGNILNTSRFVIDE